MRASGEACALPCDLSTLGRRRRSSRGSRHSQCVPNLPTKIIPTGTKIA